MIIKSVHITKFRGFRDVDINLGKNISVIVGKNGTQKTTLLGILSQAFSLRVHPTMSKEKPLCGGSYISSFREKFKLSKKYDIPGSHEWTLNLYDEPAFTIQSISRDKDSIRFWQKNTHEKGSGYIQLPVIFLSLKRLNPIGEDKKLHPNEEVTLDEAEEKKFVRLQSKILINNDDVRSTDYLESKDKTTLGIDTDYYDWQENSAGQDNLGKIILAMLSFERLKKKFPQEYKGGLLVIDEVDATLYPASQVELFDELLSFSDNNHVQIILTTHSLPFIKRTFDKEEYFSSKETTKDKVHIVYLEKKDNKIVVEKGITYNSIKNRLNVVSPNVSTNSNKISLFCEDLEALQVAKYLLKAYSNSIKFEKIKLGCNELINLVQAKVPSFSFPNCIVMLDGDVKKDERKIKKIDRLRNIMCLPTCYSPEQMLAHYLQNLSEEDKLWNNINQDYLKDVCFRGYVLGEIYEDRKKAKDWFNGQVKIYGKPWCNKILTSWKNSHTEEYREFQQTFSNKLRKCLDEKKKRDASKIV